VRLSICGGTTYGPNIHCAVRAVLHRAVFGTADRCDSELHSTACRAERTERELGLTVVLNVCVGNTLMGKADC